MKCQATYNVASQNGDAFEVGSVGTVIYIALLDTCCDRAGDSSAQKEPSKSSEAGAYSYIRFTSRYVTFSQR